MRSKSAWESVKPYRDVGASKIRYLNDEESRELVDACRIPFRYLVIGALLTGARYGELAVMRLGDFDPAAGTIHIPRSKSGKSRHIFLTEEGQRFFASIAANQRPSDLLFVRENGEAWGNSHQVRFIREACEVAGVEQRLAFISCGIPMRAVWRCGACR